MTHYDIAIIGSGSANSLPGPELADCSIVMIDRGMGPRDSFGGTCLNVGCIPTKMFVHTANVAQTARQGARFGVETAMSAADWPAIRDRIFGRIDPIADGGREYRERHEDNANLTLLHGTAHFTGPKRLEVARADGGTEEVTADTVILAGGSRPVIPSLPGIDEIDDVLTSDEVMRIDTLPQSLTILGSGVIAVEMAHVFSALGTAVTMVVRSDRVLRAADEAISQRLTQILSSRIRLVTGAQIEAVRRVEGGVELSGTGTTDGGQEGGELRVVSERLLVATGRRPNSDLLAVKNAGVGIDADGYVRVDPYQRVLDADGAVLPGVWSLGDMNEPLQLKHVANLQAKVVRHNLLHPEAMRRSDTMPVPAGVFTGPPIGCVGLTEQQARTQYGDAVRVAVQEYAGIAYGWAMEDTSGFAKIIATDDGTILGAHIIGPEAPTLVQQIVQAMSTGQRVHDIAQTQYWIHPAMPELLENALLQLL